MAGPGHRAARHARGRAHVERADDRRVGRRRAPAQQPRVGHQRRGQHRHARRARRARGRACSATWPRRRRLPMLGDAQIADYLAEVRDLAARQSRAVRTALLGPVARESTVVAVLGELDDRQPAGARRGASARLVQHRDRAAAGHDVLVARARRAAESPIEPRVQNASQVLRAAGWQTDVVRCGDPVAGVGAVAALAGRRQRWSVSGGCDDRDADPTAAATSAAPRPPPAAPAPAPALPTSTARPTGSATATCTAR